MKTFSLFLVVVILISVNFSCTKNDNNVCTTATPQSEQSKILAFASANGITATAHSTGLYYQVINAGSGATPTSSTKVFVKYTGKLTDGTTFDSQSDETKTGWLLGNLIQGWQIGLPLIKKGGIIKLILPSSMSYGCSAAGTIPPNSVLYFEIELVDVQ